MVKKRDVSKAAAALGAKGGRKSSSNMTPEERSERAKLAAKARWERKKQEEEREK
jgi:hypothetical protein